MSNKILCQPILHNNIRRTKFLLSARSPSASLITTRAEKHLAILSERFASLINLLFEELHIDGPGLVRHAILGQQDICTDFNNHRHELIELAQSKVVVSHAKY